MRPKKTILGIITAVYLGFRLLRDLKGSRRRQDSHRVQDKEGGFSSKSVEKGGTIKKKKTGSKVGSNGDRIR